MIISTQSQNVVTEKRSWIFNDYTFRVILVLF